MLEIAVIADDLTGAADTGVQFRAHFRDTILMSHGDLSPGLLTTLNMAPQGIAVYTNSRAMNAEAARGLLHQVARRVQVHQPKRVYKKVDSCLRGNLGAEVDAIVDEMGYRLSFIAPAFPEMGRTTLHDTHLVHGTPVALTELSRDPVTPVRESRLSRVVASQSRYGVVHVDVRFLDDAHEATAGEISRLAHSGARHLVFDATTPGHMEKIALMAVRSREKVLLVGSAGLARGLQRHLPDMEANDEEAAALAAGRHLLVCGTVSERTAGQVSNLLRTYPYEVIPLSPGLLADPAKGDARLERAELARRLLSGGDLIIRIDPGEMEAAGAGQRIWPWSAGEIVDGMGRFVASIIQGVRPGSLFLSGGDTANAVLDAIGARGIRLLGEILPGMVLGTIIGGLADGLPVVTKAGAFGEEDTLVALHDYWEARMRGSRDVR